MQWWEQYCLTLCLELKKPHQKVLQTLLMGRRVVDNEGRQMMAEQDS